MKLKDKKIEILRVISTKDADGFAVERYEPIHPGRLWAYFRHLSGQEIHASGATFAKEQVLFVINWREDVTSREVVRYGGRLYDISRVDCFEGYKAELSLYCSGRG